MTKPARPSASWGIAFILTAFAILALLYSAAVPVFEAPDEDSHYRYVRHLADGAGLPVLDPANPGLLAQEAGQPPLYYALTAALTGWVHDGGGDRTLAENPHSTFGRPLQPGNKNRFIHTPAESWPWQDLTAGVHAARLFSILLGLSTVYLTYRLALTLRPTRPHFALATAALVAFTPQFIFISSVVSNDNLIIFLATLALWLLVRVTADDFPRPWLAAALVGLTLGLAALTKLGGLTLLALAGFTYLLRAWSSGRWRQSLGQLAMVGLLAALIAGWWYARNWQLYGDPTGLAPFLAIVGPRPQPLTLASLPTELQGLRISLLALFGWFNLIWPEWVYRLFDLFLLAALAGLITTLWRRTRRGQSLAEQIRQYPAFLLPPAWLFLSLLSLARWITLTPAAQGRLLFPALAAIAFLLMLGWDSLWPRRPVWLAAPPAAFLALAILSLPLVIIPAYRQPPLLAAARAPVHAGPDSVVFDNRLLLLGVASDSLSLHPGDEAEITLYWQALAPVAYNATQFIKALDLSRAAVSQINSYHGWGAYPTSQWSPDTVLVDSYRLPIPANLDAPTLLSVDIGLYDYDSDRGYASQRMDGAEAPGSLLTLRILPKNGATPTPQHAAQFDFGEQIRLLGYDLGQTSVRPGDTLDLQLHWQALTNITEDYQVFVHLLDAGGQRVAGFDKSPREGRWPTSAWEPGQPVVDNYPLTLPPDLSPGVYTLAVGLYRLDSLERLSVTGATDKIANQAVWLTQVEVRP